eukprot:g17377.t1
MDDTTQASFDTVMAFMGAMGSGDMAALDSLMADDMVWHNEGDPALPWIGETVGKQNIFQFLGVFSSNLQVTKWENSDAFASGDTVAVFGRMNGITTNSGEEIGEFTFALRAKVRDGQASWHKEIVSQALTGFQQLIPSEQIDVFDVPGAFEMPLLARDLAKTGRYRAVAAAALVVDGGIYRHDFVAQAVVNGLMQAGLETGVPILSVSLTPHQFQETEHHIGIFKEHFVQKGREAAEAALAMSSIKILLAIVAAVAAAITFQHLRLSTSAPAPARADEALRIATYNVHYIILFQEQGRWGLSGWEERKAPLDSVFKALDADIIAFQEMESFFRGSDGSVNLTRDWLLENNDDYAAAAMGDWREFPSTQPIFYRQDRLDVLDQGWWFFSETPDQIYSRGFDGASPSFASWVQFADRQSGSEFRVVSVHFDAFSEQNRNGATDLTAERIAPWIEAGETVILAGDLNALHGSRVHRTLEEAGLTFPRVPHASFHLNRGLHLFGAIDHIGLSGAAAVAQEPFVLQMRPDGIWPTDHHPVAMDITLAE